MPRLASGLKAQDRWLDASKGTPRPGDLVFFDWQRDGELDHVGLVESVDAKGQIHTIEGNADDVVKRRTWSPSQIAGYGLLP